MKMTIQTEELSRALYRVQGIADRKSTMPVLAHVLLDATADGELTVSATDLDVGLSGKYKAEVATPGSVAVHARQLYEIVKALPADKVEVERGDNNWITLKSGSSRFQLVGMAADEFPALPSHAQIKTFTIPAKDLVKMIDRTIFCVSTDDNRHNLSGIYCEARGSKTLRMVATDGHRLAMSEGEFTTDIKLDKGVIVPRKGFQELKRVLGDAEGAENVELGFSGTNGMLKAGSVILSTRLVEGLFPEYDQVIPKQSDKAVKIARGAFSEALRRVSLLSQSRAYGVRLKLDAHKLELVAEDPELGNASESIDVDYNGPALTIGFNARYILDVLQHVNDEGVVFELSDDLSPGVLKPLEEKGFLAVVMPMRI
jgi:DNA polymerase-3 subunit beta